MSFRVLVYFPLHQDLHCSPIPGINIAKKIKICLIDGLIQLKNNVTTVPAFCQMTLWRAIEEA